MRIKVFTDGGARGNPGRAGCGVVVKDEKEKIIYEESKFLGVKTNNEAEYLGLITALTWINNQSDPEVELYSDSELLVRQMRGEYKVKATNLKNLWLTAKNLSKSIKIIFIEISRELNFEADELANLAMDRER
ncbi:ribonuclease H [Candidatus Shapirobacteria bacterium CG06_land_8_20_14_3_00_40_12]|uniref:Ribonuclease H n=2 Tax=Candidatus Shapironibacteriota TaxID=1752721 RepID=A0A2M7TS44_9BACT|nr:MAG: ribonuclease H [Candidatus Shapirobacteria bacterium CG06_land_8_20_14_3_00_40_12]PIZ57836.1 MAG: ribonuclease H [Candidatus Shapirobacteria bacterium CG_4_10_14_0_2_um_filter_40_12]